MGLITVYNIIKIILTIPCRQNPNEPMVLRLTASSVQNSYFDPNRDTAVIVHGHRANAFNSLNPSVKDGEIYFFI